MLYVALTELCDLVHSPSHPPAVEDSYIDFLHTCATPSSADDDSGFFEAASGDVAAADVASGHVAPGHVATNHASPGHVEPLEAAPDHVAAADVAASDVAPGAGIRKAHLLAFLSQVPASEVSAALQSLGTCALSCMPFVLFVVVLSLNGRVNRHCFDEI